MKTHWRKAMESPYLSSSDIDGESVLTIERVVFESDLTKRTKDSFNTAHFVEKFIRPEEKLAPMILNKTNSQFLAELTGSPYLEDWGGVKVAVTVRKVKYGKDMVEGLLLSKPVEKPFLTPESDRWAGAVAAYQKSGNIEAILKRVQLSPEHIELIKAEAST